MGLIHRDIKPANVFLCDRGGMPDSVKVLDFGLVKHVSEQAGRHRSPREMPGADGIVGTPNFIAPGSDQGLQPGGRAQRLVFARARSDIFF